MSSRSKCWKSSAGGSRRYASGAASHFPQTPIIKEGIKVAHRRLMRGGLLARFHPSAWKPSLDAAYSLLFDYAHLSSVQRQAAVDAKCNPVPWYTYPAIEYLKQLDFKDSTVFEYGSG